MSCMFNRVGYNVFLKISWRFKDVKGVIVNTFSELERHIIDSFSNGLNPPVFTVGPLLDLSGQPASDLNMANRQYILKWLDDQPDYSVVFLCFGKGSFSPAQVKEIAIGLEQSKYRFLWSLRVSEPNNESSGSTQTPDHDHFPEGLMERTKARGLICGRAPQVDVLAHRAIGDFVSHRGWNSILKSLWFGVPIVTWPLYAEQRLNAFQMVKELGLAVELRLDSRINGKMVSADEIAMSGDNEIRKRVKEVSEIARNSLTERGSSFVSIKKFIDLLF